MNLSHSRSPMYHICSTFYTSLAMSSDSSHSVSPIPSFFQEKGERFGMSSHTVYLVDRQIFFIVRFAFAHKSAFTVPQYVETFQWKCLFVNKGSIFFPPSMSSLSPVSLGFFSSCTSSRNDKRCNCSRRWRCR